MPHCFPWPARTLNHSPEVADRTLLEACFRSAQSTGCENKKKSGFFLLYLQIEMFCHACAIEDLCIFFGLESLCAGCDIECLRFPLFPSIKIEKPFLRIRALIYTLRREKKTPWDTPGNHSRYCLCSCASIVVFWKVCFGTSHYFKLLYLTFNSEYMWIQVSVSLHSNHQMHKNMLLQFIRLCTNGVRTSNLRLYTLAYYRLYALFLFLLFFYLQELVIGDIFNMKIV